jgi:hypothetical protein
MMSPRGAWPLKIWIYTRRTHRGALLIIALTFGTAGLQLMYAAVYFVLLACRQYNSLSVDRVLGAHRGKAVFSLREKGNELS